MRTELATANSDFLNPQPVQRLSYQPRDNHDFPVDCARCHWGLWQLPDSPDDWSAGHGLSQALMPWPSG